MPAGELKQAVHPLSTLWVLPLLEDGKWEALALLLLHLPITWPQVAGAHPLHCQGTSLC